MGQSFPAAMCFLFRGGELPETDASMAACMAAPTADTGTADTSRGLDIVLLGPTSFVGRLVCEEIAQNYSVSCCKGRHLLAKTSAMLARNHRPRTQGLKWAMAGRDLRALRTLRSDLASGFGACGDVPLLWCDVLIQDSVDEAVRQAKVPAAKPPCSANATGPISLSPRVVVARQKLKDRWPMPAGGALLHGALRPAGRASNRCLREAARPLLRRVRCGRRGILPLHLCQVVWCGGIPKHSHSVCRWMRCPRPPAGEVPWIRRMIVRYPARAEAAGVKIVNACGYQAVASDLGVYLLAKYMRERLNRWVDWWVGWADRCAGGNRHGKGCCLLRHAALPWCMPGRCRRCSQVDCVVQSAQGLSRLGGGFRCGSARLAHATVTARTVNNGCHMSCLLTGTAYDLEVPVSSEQVSCGDTGGGGGRGFCQR